MGLKSRNNNYIMGVTSNMVMLMVAMIMMMINTTTAETSLQTPQYYSLQSGWASTNNASSSSDEPLPDVKDLSLDLAYVRFVSNITTSLNISYVYGACYSCAYQPLTEVVGVSSSEYLELSTSFSYTFNASVYDAMNRLITSILFEYQFGERGLYDIAIVEYDTPTKKSINYSIETIKHPVNAFIPIAVMFAILVSMALAWPVILHYYRKSKAESLEFQLQNLESNNPKKDRLRSLDVFRGLSITIMIFVNYGGGGYWFFNHAYWNGITLADIVFPWFIYIMGVAMPLSFSAMENRGTPKKTVFLSVIRRSIILFLLGMFLNNGNNLGNWRILGVLQRFGVSYFVTASIMLFVPLWRYRRDPEVQDDDQYNINNQNNNAKVSPLSRFNLGQFSDIIPFWLQWVVILLLLLVWFLVTFLLPVPGCPTGYMGPGGLADNGQYKDCTGGAARLIDISIFTNNHIYQTPTCQDIYQTGSYDPEGTLGYLTSILMCFFGVQAGRIFLLFKDPKQRIIRFLCWSIVLMAIATGLCGAKQNGGWVPINKNLWTPSFVILISGFAFLVLTAFYFVVDVKKIWNGAPLLYIGMNPITIYCGHEILGGFFPFSFHIAPKVHSLFLLSNCIGTGCWLLIAFAMYKNKVFINI